MANLPLIVSCTVKDASNQNVVAADNVTPSGYGADIWPYVMEWQEDENLDGPEYELTLIVKAGSPWHMQGTLQERHRLIVGYDTDDDGAANIYRAFRIRTLDEGYGAASSVKVQAWSLDTELGDQIWSKVLTPSTIVTQAFHRTAMTVTNILTDLFGGIRPEFVKGTVATSLASLEVSIYANASSAMQILRVLADAIRTVHGLSLEYETSFNNATGDLTFNFYEERGWSASERSGGSADPDLRPIDAPTGDGTTGTMNLIGAQFQRTGSDFFSRLYPYGGSENERIGIGGTYWDVATAAYNATDGETTLTLSDNPIYKTNSLADPRLGAGFCVANSSDTFYLIQETTSPDTVVVTGDASSETALRFANMDSAFTVDWDVAFVHDKDAEDTHGLVERVIDLPDVRPFANLLLDAGVSVDLSDWTTSAYPDGWNPLLGTETITEATDYIYVEHGTSSCKVACGTDAGLVTDSITLAPTQLSPYFSAWALVRVESGSVRLELVDSAGEVHPVGVTHYEGNADYLEAIAFGGTAPAAGAAVLRLRALEDSTVFYLDAATLCQSVGWWPYAERMGPRALWAAAAEILLEQGGVRPAGFETDFLDAYFFDAMLAEAKAGAHCRLRTLYDYASAAYLKDVTGRITTVRTGTLGAEMGKPYKRIKVARSNPSLSDRLAPGGIRQVSPPDARAPEPGYPVAPPTQEDSEATLRTWAGYFTLLDGTSTVIVIPDPPCPFPLDANAAIVVTPRTAYSGMTNYYLPTAARAPNRFELYAETGPSGADVEFDWIAHEYNSPDTAGAAELFFGESGGNYYYISDVESPSASTLWSIGSGSRLGGYDPNTDLIYYPDNLTANELVTVPRTNLVVGARSSVLSSATMSYLRLLPSQQRIYLYIGSNQAREYDYSGSTLRTFTDATIIDHFDVGTDGIFYYGGLSTIKYFTLSDPATKITLASGLSNPGGSVNFLRVDADAGYLFIARTGGGSSITSIERLDLHAPTGWTQLFNVASASYAINCMELDPDRQRIYFACTDGALRRCSYAAAAPSTIDSGYSSITSMSLILPAA